MERYLALLYGDKTIETATDRKGRKNEKGAPDVRQKGEISEISQEAAPLISHNSLISHPSMSARGAGNQQSPPIQSVKRAEPADKPHLEPEKTNQNPQAREISEISEISRVAEQDQFDHLSTAQASEVPLAHPTTAAERPKWADTAAQILKELGRHQRGDFSRRRWQQTLAGVQRFVESGWAHRAWGLGWHLLELFGVDRRAPWARLDRRGLALMLGGSKVIALTDHGATIQTETGAHLTYSRKPIELLEVVLVDQIARAYRLPAIKREWAEILERVDRSRPPLDANISDVRWHQYRADLRRLAGENWDYSPIFFMDWDGRGSFPPRAKRALAWRIGGGTITNLTHDTAICGKVVFRRLPGDQGWQKDVDLDQGREKAPKWLAN
jgi:hypothetical protein